ncbi:hypothetical protein HU200_005104 [Digitaria exilis]|uniref:RNase H type-1 domain-containing protein n=1 Tax=Digitaria exilis TaxID=1010633 RepID=A0A835FSJ7_9POAL|nr:hypothetical protein HU200_005104 [Digitaria exilis]
MREHCLLPDEEQFVYSGPNWFLLLLDRCSPIQRDLVKLVLWRAWTTHNNITHQSGQMNIGDGVQALLSMRSSLEQIVGEHRGVKGEEKQHGWSKINVDGSFVEATGEAGVGVIARDSVGQVIFSGWRVLFNCSDEVEAEARACVEGIRLATEWAPGPVIIESDCARLVRLIQDGPDRSEIGFIVSEALELTQILLEWKVSLVGRDCNIVAHELA